MTSLSASTKRYAETTITDDMKKMRYSKGTNYQTSYARKLFTDYLTKKGYLIEPTSQNLKETLDIYTQEFLVAIRKEDGEQFSRGGFDGVYFALARSHMDDYSVDILNDPAFIKIKNAKKAVRAVLKKIGKGSVTHTDIVNDDDLVKISKLPVTTPINLQLKTWFLIHFHLAMRGNENDNDLMKIDVIISQENGKKFVELRDTVTKNHRGDSNDKSSGAKMFASRTSDCPVECIETYLSKLNPNNDYMWQRPKKKFQQSAPIWFDAQKIGINQIRKFMKTLSQVAVLSKMYTNHAPRATCITILGRNFADTDVATHSGHKSLAAMGLYKRTSEKTKLSMSQLLSESLSSEPEINACTDTDGHHNCCLSLGSSNYMENAPTASTPQNDSQVEAGDDNLHQVTDNQVLPLLNDLELDQLLLINSVVPLTEIPRSQIEPANPPQSYTDSLAMNQIENVNCAVSIDNRLANQKEKLSKAFLNCSFSNCSFNFN